MHAEVYLDALIENNQDPDGVATINLPIRDYIGLLKNNLVDYISVGCGKFAQATFFGVPVNKTNVSVRSYTTKEGKTVEF